MGRFVFHLVAYAATALVVYFFLTRHARPAEDLLFVRWLLVALFAPSLVRYSIQLFVAPWYEFVMGRRRKRRLESSSGPPPRPLVSVLVPAWNEEVGIQTAVRSILDSDYPELEVVVVDDGSTDATGERLAQLAATEGTRGRLVVHRQDNAGKSRALNTALGLARGEIIITIDADSVVDREAVTRIVRLFEDERVMSVAGNVKIGNRASAIGLLQQLEYLYGFYFKKADSLLNSIYIVGGAAAAYRRRVFEELGGFDETIITEDIELSTRIQDAGMVIQYAPDAVVWTEGAAELHSLARQRLRWKFGRLVTFWRYRHMFFSLRRHHSKLLTLLILPVAVLSEVLLLFEVFLLALLYAYTFRTNDFLPLIVYMCLVTVVITVQVLTDPKRRENRNLLLIAPGAWLLIYCVDAVELQALVRSLWRLSRRKGLEWQRWRRVGVFQAAPRRALPDDDDVNGPR